MVSAGQSCILFWLGSLLILANQLCLKATDWPRDLMKTKKGPRPLTINLFDNFYYKHDVWYVCYDFQTSFMRDMISM